MSKLKVAVVGTGNVAQKNYLPFRARDAGLKRPSPGSGPWCWTRNLRWPEERLRQLSAGETSEVVSP